MSKAYHSTRRALRAFERDPRTRTWFRFITNVTQEHAHVRSRTRAVDTGGRIRNHTAHIITVPPIAPRRDGEAEANMNICDHLYKLKCTHTIPTKRTHTHEYKHGTRRARARL